MKLKRSPLILVLNLVCALLISSMALAQQMPEYLLGSWQINDRTSYEQWQKIEDNKFQGQIIETAGGIQVTKELLSLELRDGQLIYKAQVLNQK